MRRLVQLFRLLDRLAACEKCYQPMKNNGWDNLCIDHANETGHFVKNYRDDMGMDRR